MSAMLESNLTGLLPLLFYVTVFAVVFIETALIFAFFIPGDTLLFSAGLVVAASENLNLLLTMTLIGLAAFLGDQSAYFIGKRFGISYISKRDSAFLDQMLVKAQTFYRKHGIATIFLSRFYPWFRTLIPFLAGVGEMPRRKFVAINAISATMWGSLITSMGYFANSIPALHASSKYIAGFFIFLTMLLALKNYRENKSNLTY